jgi:NarL family two-component system response regulator LiaR
VTGPDRIRVLIVDNHDLFRVGLSATLAADERLEVVAQASGGRMAVRLAEELRPDVILMDLRMTDLSGVDATRAILKTAPATRIIVLTVVAGTDAVAAAINAGVCGYLLKDAAGSEILGAIHAAVSGDAWLSPRAARAVLERVRSDEAHAEASSHPETGLSRREQEVLQRLASGLDNSQIAAELSISPRTAKSHVSNILTKLGVSSRVEAAVYATRIGLI